MITVIHPSNLKGTICPPTSKSMLHRAIIIASLIDGESKLMDVDLCDDTLATINACKALGASITYDNNNLYIKGVDFKSLKGRKLNISFSSSSSASTLRFMIPILLQIPGKKEIFVNDDLAKRPLTTYLSLFGDAVKVLDKKAILTSSKIKSKIVLDDLVSSQFVSGLILASLITEEEVLISLNGKEVSRPYVDMTISMAKEFGASIDVSGNSIKVEKNQNLHAKEMYIEKDYSAAAFFYAVKEQGYDINIFGLNENSLQADKIIENLLKGYSDHFDVDLSNCPDLGPILFAISGTKRGLSVFYNASRLEYKESNRISAMKEELEKFGIGLEKVDEKVVIIPSSNIYSNDDLYSHGDHRIYMALVYLSIVSNSHTKIYGAEAITKSYPNFLSDLKMLGLNIEIIEE